MTTTHSTNNNNNNNNNLEIPLKLSKILEDSGIIHKFVIDTDDKYVKLRLNSMYNPPISIDVPINLIKEKNGWEKFANKFRDVKKTFKQIDSNHNTWIYSTINENGSLIRSYLNNSNNGNSNTQQQSYLNHHQQHQQQNESDELDASDTTENATAEKIIEKLSVSQAIRKNSGRISVTGTIIGVSRLFKMISNARLYCDKCGMSDEIIFNPIPISNIKNIKENCKSCGKYIQYYNIKPLDHKNTVIIELQDTNSFDELDRLSVYLFDEDTIDIKVGENVEIIGEIKILDNKFKLYLPYLYGESIQYLNRANFMLTKSDIEMNKEFNETNKNNVINELVSLFDPSIVECEFEKKGVLMCAVNTSTKVGDQSEHLDILFIGPPGLAKSKLLKRATELVPGSNRAGGQYSTGKSLTAIVEKTDDNTFLRLGSIPRSRDAICGINELAKLSQEDLDKLYDVMEERELHFEKYGIKANIQTPTAIIASANPANKDSWINNEKVDFNELPFLAPLKDRFDLIFIFQYKQTQKERDEFADKLSDVEAKKERGELPDHTEFLIKYIQYAKQFNPILTDEARFMLTEFYKKVSTEGFGSPRVLKTLTKIAKAIARLKLKNVADEEDANETMEFYNAILVKFQKSVVYSESPKMLAYKKGVEIIKRFENFGGITLEQIFETMCQEDKQLASYFGYDNDKSLKIQDNHKASNVKKLLLTHTNIKRVHDNPIVLKWFDDSSSQSDQSDQSDEENYSKQEKNDKNFNKNELEPTSDGSDGSDSDTITGFRMSPKGRFYQTTPERHRELKYGGG
jgi:replicative DNA helicase Mcm